MFGDTSFSPEVDIRHPELLEVMVIQCDKLVSVVEPLICQLTVVVESPEPESHFVLLV